MFEVIWLPDALKDLDRQFEFLNERDPQVASRAVRAILGAGASLASLPERGTAIPKTT
jgi:plasmid stabilization system protein ParE